MIVEQDPKAWYDTILHSKDKSFALLLFALFIMIAFNIFTWVHFTNKADASEIRAIKAETDLNIFRGDMLKTNIDYNNAVTIAVNKVNIDWQKKYDLLLEDCKKDHDAITEKRIQELTVKSERILKESRRMNSQINKQNNK